MCVETEKLLSLSNLSSTTKLLLEFLTELDYLLTQLWSPMSCVWSPHTLTTPGSTIRVDHIECRM